MRILLLFTQIIFILSSCQPNTNKVFFNFDEIIHYSNSEDGLQTQKLVDNQAMTGTDSLKLHVMFGNTPANIDDWAFVEYLEEIGFNKRNIDRNRFKDINEVFSEKTTDEIFSASCIPIYRDILIFKNQDKIVGMVKICFDCMDHQIFGTKLNTSYFGQDGDFRRLKELLKY